MSEQVEEWRAVPGYEGAYEVSDWGRLRAIERVIVDTLGRRRRMRGHLLAQQTRKDGYSQAHLSFEGRDSIEYLHDMVLAAFVGPKPAGNECRHRNNQRSDNHLVNLHYGTRQENQADRVDHGTDIRGEQVHGAVLTEEDVRYIRRSHLNGPELGLLFGVNRATINYVRRRETWAHVD